MKDTGFSVPAAKLDRLATSYWVNPATGALELYDEAAGGQWSRPPAFPSGGGGLVSTVDDYLAFGQMMLNKGRHGSERILSRPSVETDDDRPADARAEGGVRLRPGYFDSHGWGFGVSVVTRRDDVAGGPRTLRLGRRLRHVLVFRSRGGHGRDPDDPARLDFPQSSDRLSRFLDLGLPGDRRLGVSILFEDGNHPEPA